MEGRHDMSNDPEYDATEGGAINYPHFGPDEDYHIIQYKKSPYVIYD